MANANIAIVAYIVSTTLAPSPEIKPALCPLLNDYCTTRMAIGPIGAEAQIPTRKALNISTNIIPSAFINIQSDKDSNNFHIFATA